MFCFQCEQTAGCTGCTGNTGVCGKKADTAQLQDELTGALIGLARAVDDTSAVSKKTWQTIIEGLFTTITNVSFDNAAIEDMIQKVRAEKTLWLATVINVSLLVDELTNMICNNYGMLMKISVPEVTYSLWYSRNGCICLSCICPEF